MLLVEQNTPPQAYELPFGWRMITCQPTYYLGLSYLGFNQVLLGVDSHARIVSGSAADYLAHLICLVLAFVMAQVLELHSRPLRQPGIDGTVRRERVPRISNLTLGFGGNIATLAADGWPWNGHAVALITITLCTTVGEVLYQTYGKKHPYQAASREAATGPARDAEPTGLPAVESADSGPRRKNRAGSSPEPGRLAARTKTYAKAKSKSTAATARRSVRR
jgi:hypothetical protein